MKRRLFLMGLGKFAGAALALPIVPTIFDMGRRIVVPEPRYDFTVAGKGFVYKNGTYTYIGAFVTHGNETYRSDTMDVTCKDGTRFIARNGELWRVGPAGPVEVTFSIPDSGPSFPVPTWRNVDPISVYPEWRNGELHQLSLTPSDPSSGNAGASALHV